MFSRRKYFIIFISAGIISQVKKIEKSLKNNQILSYGNENNNITIGYRPVIRKIKIMTQDQ